jgi:Leucine-rich repeat (LRR) protein
MKRIGVFLITVVLIVGTVGCGDGGGSYTLTIASNAGGSVIEPGEGTFSYNASTVVDLVAQPDEGYYFVSWTGNVDTINNVDSRITTITMHDDYSISANFEMIPAGLFALTISSSDGGSVTVPGEATFIYDEGTVVDLVAASDVNHHFAEWSGDVDTVFDVAAASTTITMQGNYEITASFAANTHTLSINSNLNGSVTTPGEGTYTYDYDTVVNLVAAPDVGYHFVNWTGDVGTLDDGNAAATTITMKGDYSITANFGEGEEVIFPDPNLEAVVRDGIGIPEGPIYPSDLEGYTVLHGSADEISDLAGIEQCIDLIEVYLGSNQISDISPLSSLTNVTVLFLQNNQIADISPLAGLTNLTSLLLRDNVITDISCLASLTNLDYLNVGFNQIDDSSALANLTSLTELYTRGNQISDISPLANLTNLTLFWHDSNHLSDISPLANLTNLTNLNIGYNQISDVSPLANLTNLTWISIRYNDISDVSPFANLTNLDSLDIGYNDISGISPLASLTDLTELYLGSNQISDISPLASLTSLTVLDLGDNQISDISTLANLTSLTVLDLWGNQISDISALANLTNVTSLLLAWNQIGDISPLVQNEGLGTGDTVNLQQNPLSEESINTCIPELEARGVDVIC